MPLGIGQDIARVGVIVWIDQKPKGSVRFMAKIPALQGRIEFLQNFFEGLLRVFYEAFGAVFFRDGKTAIGRKLRHQCQLMGGHPQKIGQMVGRFYLAKNLNVPPDFFDFVEMAHIGAILR